MFLRVDIETRGHENDIAVTVRTHWLKMCTVYTTYEGGAL